MKKLYVLFAAVLMVSGASVTAAANPLDVTSLSNKDVLTMVEKKMATEAIIAAIKSSPCTFDTFPSVMKELQRRGVPEEVLEAMIDAPYGPAESNRPSEELVEEPIYHYTENIKQFLSPLNAGRRANAMRTRTRAARNPRIRR